MIINPVPENADFFAALASDVRLKIIQLLSKDELNIKELAEKVGVSSPIMLKHVQALEKAGIVTSRLVKKNGTVSRVCTLVFAEYRFMIETRRRNLPSVQAFSIPVGQYYDISGTPTCGLATAESVLTVMDDPRVFWEPDRINAQLLWFTQGHVAYRVPDYLNEDQKLVELEVSFEIASEAPDFADDWPSDISFYMNGIRLFTWISPGDFGVKRGILTPEWWPSNQYGLLKTVRVLPDGTYLDGERVSEITLEDVSAARQQFWDIRFEIAEDAEHVGGISLFGKQFGNYAQDIVMRVFFEKITEE